MTDPIQSYQRKREEYEEEIAREDNSAGLGASVIFAVVLGAALVLTTLVIHFFVWPAISQMIYNSANIINDPLSGCTWC